ncbi:MAG: SDR family NAD(P)-dependent oxidoreductase, partial [Candidatus Dormibacteraeota bacterium]|nr:SDR family NAD(P)-dependent oxidoreductase [Candidatus Dormibacteraeota bacterium]
LDPKTDLDELQVNVVALTHLTKLFLPGMIARGDGRILNVASIAAFEPGPLMAVYYASKAYVLSFSEALANEVEGTGVSVTTLCPGITRTGFQARGAMEDSRLVQGEMADAASVALAGYRAVMTRKGVVVPGLGNKVVSVAVRLAPRSVVTRMVRRAQERVR